MLQSSGRKPAGADLLLTLAMYALHPLHGDAPSDWHVFETALASAGLPQADLGEPGQEFFSLIEATSVLGYGGYLLAGEDALLRSIVVPAPNRRRGIGTALVGALLDQLRLRGVRHVWLLTTDAAAFFKRLGFTKVDRLSVPASIAATRQFKEICPGTATLMRHDLNKVKDGRRRNGR